MVVQWWSRCGLRGRVLTSDPSPHPQVEVQRRPWFYVDEEDGPQVGGFVKDFDHISFLTVKVRPRPLPQVNL